MAADPTAAYRKQQHMAPVTHSYDPKVVAWTVQAAKATGADPAALLATALQESGARTGAVGDQGTSFGPWQMHRGGALANHNPAWANSYAAALNRAQEFARLQVHGGVGAAAVQRPADRSLYAQGVDKYLAQAKAILAHYQGGTVPAAPNPAAPKPTSPAAPVAPLIPAPAAPLITAYRTNDSANIGDSLLQSLIDANAQNAGIQSIQLPVMPTAPTLPAPAINTNPRAPKTPRTPASPTTPTTPATAPSPTSHKAAKFEGTTVAAWMVPALVYARQHGWKGQLTSGVRSTALQAQLYARYKAGGNIAAKPGQSNHELQNGGAFDATDSAQLNAILKGFNGRRPIWAMTVGLNDTPHFSLTGR
jgi:hypothetical protein